MKVTVIPVIVGALETIAKGLLRRLEKLEVGGRAQTIDTTALLRSAKNTEKRPEDLLSLSFLVKDHQLTLVEKKTRNE